MFERKVTRFNGERLVFEPRGPLASWIDGIRICDAPEPLDQPAPRRIVPDRCAHLIYYRFGAPGVLAGGRVPAGASGLTWVGPRNVYKDIERRGRAITMIVSFKAGATAGLVRYPVNELADTGVLACDVLSEGAEPLGDRLVDRLDAAPTTAAMIPILADELNRMSRQVKLDPLVQEAVRLIAVPRGVTSLGQLARELGIGERRLRERFGRAVGLSPKRFARITRISRVFEQFAALPTRTWGRIAHDAGYADHPHMIREFNELLGESPARFAGRLSTHT